MRSRGDSPTVGVLAVVALMACAGATAQGTADAAGRAAEAPCLSEPKSALAVAPLFQRTDFWCWAATGEMVMGFLGTPHDQCAQANHQFSRSDCCSQRVPQGCVQGGWPDFRAHGFRFIASSNPLSWDELRAEVSCRRRPIAFAWRYSGGGGHIMSAIGYAEADGVRTVLVNDPWPTNEGDQWIVTYEAFVSGPSYSHWRTYHAIEKE